MLESLRCIFTVGLLLSMPFILAGIFLIPGMSRKRFSLLTTLIVAGQMFILVIIYSKSNTVLIGTIMFLLMLPSGYLTMYLIYPGLQARDEKRRGLRQLYSFPYGETRWTTGTIYTDQLFTGQREMAGLGIYDYGVRFYLPKLLHTQELTMDRSGCRGSLFSITFVVLTPIVVYYLKIYIQLPNCWDINLVPWKLCFLFMLQQP